MNMTIMELMTWYKMLYTQQQRQINHAYINILQYIVDEKDNILFNKKTRKYDFFSSVFNLCIDV